MSVIFDSKDLSRWIVTTDNKHTSADSRVDSIVFNISSGDYFVGEERFSLDELIRPYESVVQKEAFEVWSQFCDRNRLVRNFSSGCGLLFPKEVSYIYECNNWSRFLEYNVLLRLAGVLVLAREADVNDVFWKKGGDEFSMEVYSSDEAVSTLNSRSVREVFQTFLFIPWDLLLAFIKASVVLSKLLLCAIIEKMNRMQIDCLQGDMFVGYSSGLGANRDQYWGDLHTRFGIGGHHFWEIPRKSILFRLKNICSKNSERFDVIRWLRFSDFVLTPLHYIFYAFGSSIRLSRFFVKRQTVLNELILHITKKSLIRMLVGTGVIEVLLFINVLKGFSDKLDSSARVFFLWEGQAWEKILCYACRQRNIETIGVPHTTITKWCARSYVALYSDLTSVKPDRYAVNSEHAQEYIKRNSKIDTAVVAVESLRYSNYLGIKHKRGTRRRRSDTRIISVLGDYDQRISSDLVDCLKALRNRYPDSQIFWRSHPSAVLEGALADAVSEVVDESEMALDRLLERSDLVVCSESSSVSLDFCLVGCPVILVRSSVSNMISLDIDDLRLIGLADFINGIDIFSPENQNWGIGEKLGFFLNSNLPAWATILGYQNGVSRKHEF